MRSWIAFRSQRKTYLTDLIQKLTHENSLRIDIPKEGIVNPFYILDPKREYIFTGLDEYKDKINAFRPWLESLVTKK